MNFFSKLTFVILFSFFSSQVLAQTSPAAAQEKCDAYGWFYVVDQCIEDEGTARQYCERFGMVLLDGDCIKEEPTVPEETPFETETPVLETDEPVDEVDLPNEEESLDDSDSEEVVTPAPAVNPRWYSNGGCQLTAFAPSSIGSFFFLLALFPSFFWVRKK